MEFRQTCGRLVPRLIISICWFQSVVKLKNGDGKIMSPNRTRCLGRGLGVTTRVTPLLPLSHLVTRRPALDPRRISPPLLPGV